MCMHNLSEMLQTLFNYLMALLQAESSTQTHQVTYPLTQIVYGVAGFVEGAGVKFEADDGEYEDSKHDEKSDLRKWGQGLQYGLENHLQTCDRFAFTFS